VSDYGVEMPNREKQRKRTGGEEGQALLEFAFVAVFLVLVIFAVMDFARLFFAYATMANGAREGARYGIVHPPDNPGDPDDPGNQDIESVARGMLVLIGDEADVTINYPGDDHGHDSGCTRPHLCRIQVVLTTTLDVWTPVLPSIPIVAQATMHFE
jgi:hypothetical protein